MSYVINYSGGNITIPIGQANTSGTSLTLIGRNWTSSNASQGFGQALNQNFVSLLENFAGTSTPSNPIKGQLWLDTSGTYGNLKLYNNSNSWSTVYTSTSSITQIANGTSNVNIPNADGNVNISVGGTANVFVAKSTGANVNGTLTATTLQTTNITTGSVGTTGSITGTWTLVGGSTLQATYADLAEYYTMEKPTNLVGGPGSVVEFGGNAEIRICDTDMSTRVAGVISTDPAYLMNCVDDGLAKEAVALQGRVPCKVIGKTKKGDLMVSAGSGYARAEENPKIGSVIGKSLENKDYDELGTIEVVVGRL